MATNYNPFGNLIKITKWASWTGLTDAQKAGSIVFVDTTNDSTSGAEKKKIIYANGITYSIADSASFDELYNYVHNTVDASITNISTFLHNLDASVVDLSTYVYTTVNSSIQAIDASLAKIDTSIKADEATLKDLSTYVYTTVNSSIQAIDASLALIDASLKAAVKDVTLDSDVDTANNLKISITQTKEDGTSSNSDITISGDNYIQFTNNASLALKVADTKKLIADSSSTDSSVATAYAVKEYVQDQISTLESALEFKGSIDSSTDAVAKLTTAATSKGDTWVSASTTAFTYDGKKIEQGDLIIVTADSVAGAASSIIVVERNLDGAVTSEVELTENHVVLGAGKQKVTTSDYVLGTDASHASVTTTLATEKWVDLTVKDATDALKLTVNSSTTDYLIGRQGDASLAVEYGVITATLADGSNGVKGLAMADDVATVIKDNEAVIANAFSAVKTSVGLEETFEVSWGGMFADGETMVQAIKDLSTAVSGVAGKSLTVDSSTPTYLVGSTNGSLGVKYGAVVVTYANSSANGTDGLASISDLVSVINPIKSHIDVIDSSIAKIKTATGLTDTLTVDWNIKFAAGTTMVDAIIDLSTDLAAVRDDMIKEVNGEDPLTVDASTMAVDEYVAVSATETDGVVTLDASVLVAKQPTREDGAAATTAKGLATDGYVQDYVANVLMWEVID